MRTAACFLVFLLLSGCPRRVIDYGKDGEPRSAADLLARVRASELAVTSVKGEAKLKASSDRGSGTAGLFVAVKEPSVVHLEALDFFGRPQAQLITDGKRFGLYDAQAGKYFVGPATAANLSRVLPVTIPPAELAALLLGRVPRVEGVEPTMSVDADRAVIVVLLGQQRLEIEVPANRVVKSTMPGAYGVEMSQLEPFAQGTFPWRASLEAHGARMDLSWKEVELNGAIDDAMFDMSAPEGVPLVEVDGQGLEIRAGP